VHNIHERPDNTSQTSYGRTNRHAGAERAAPFDKLHDHDVQELLLRPWWCDPAALPRREFLHNRHYVRGSVSATVAAGGRAKTTLSCFEAVSMAVGRDLSSGEIFLAGPLGVLLVNGEEDQTELDRRVAAICHYYKITEAELGGRLFVLSVRQKPMRLAVVEKGLVKIDNDIRNRLLRLADRYRIDVLFFDPLVSFHGLDENNNAHMDMLIKEAQLHREPMSPSTWSIMPAK
jgi:RecA-family ATPase